MIDPTKTDITNLDWTGFEPPKDVCYCRCEAVFESFAKFVHDVPRYTSGMVSQDPCPGCGSRVNLRRVSSGPFTEVL